MLFDKPQWKWSQADGAKDYGYVSNLLTVTHAGGHQTFVRVNIPAVAFAILEAIGTPAFRKKLREGAEFCLDEEGKHWILSVRRSEEAGASVTQLWYYTDSNVPAWMLRG